MMTPEKLQKAHRHSISHGAEIMQSTMCGCFYCCSVYPPEKIEEWVEDEGRTALCPCCGIDSVIGDRSGFEISPEFLAEMRSWWFW